MINNLIRASVALFAASLIGLSGLGKAYADDDRRDDSRRGNDRQWSGSFIDQWDFEYAVGPSGYYNCDDRLGPDECNFNSMTTFFADRTLLQSYMGCTFDEQAVYSCYSQAHGSWKQIGQNKFEAKIVRAQYRGQSRVVQYFVYDLKGRWNSDKTEASGTIKAFAVPSADENMDLDNVLDAIDSEPSSYLTGTFLQKRIGF